MSPYAGDKMFVSQGAYYKVNWSMAYPNPRYKYLTGSQKPMSAQVILFSAYLCKPTAFSVKS